MKRRQILAIFAALALAVSSSVLLTGCAGKSYYFKAVVQPDGTVSYENMGEITSSSPAAAESTATEIVPETPQSSAEESSEAPAESSEGEESKADRDESILAVIKFEKPEDWDGSALCLRVYDDDSNNNTPGGQTMELGADGLYFVNVSKVASSGNEFNNPHFIFLCTTESGKVVQSEEGNITGDATYSVTKDGRKYLLNQV